MTKYREILGSAAGNSANRTLLTVAMYLKKLSIVS